MTAPAIEDLLRELAPQALGTLARRYGHFEDCEDAVQEAVLAATVQWPAEGVPASPRGWLTTVASRRLIDQARSDHARREREAATALTLRAVGGLTTAEIARALLVPEATMAARISRAKQRIKAAGSSFSLPAAAEREERLRVGGQRAAPPRPRADAADPYPQQGTHDGGRRPRTAGRAGPHPVGPRADR